ncbi:MAG: methionyl-tRNA formyltransferase [Actinomycetes bacterium]
MRVLFAGTPDAAVPVLQAVLASHHEVAAVLTRPDAASGRGRRLTPSPVARAADAAGLEVLTPATVSDPGFVERVAELSVECAPIVAYGGLIPVSLLDLPEHGWVNLHFSLLPAWRGAAPVQRALLAGDPVTGATTFRLDAGLDTGPVYGVVTETVRPSDTTGDLLGRLASSGAALLVRTLDGIETGELVAVPQGSDGVSLAPKVLVDEARVDWSAPALRVERLVRACSPAPGAWTTARGERLKVFPVEVAADLEDPGPGVLVVAKRSVHVGTGSSPVRLGVVQSPGRAPMPAQDWARGLRLTSGEALT